MNSRNDAVTVLIPAFNEQAAIVATVRGLLAQTLTGPLDIIVVDDGSTDDTYALARNTFAAEARVCVLTQRHAGKVPALNFGLSRACGDVTVVLSAGTALAADAIAGLLRAIANDNLGAALCRSAGDGRTVVSAWRTSAVHDVGGFSDDTIAEDQDLALALRRSGWQVAVTMDAVAASQGRRVRQRVRQRVRRVVGRLQCAWKYRRASRSAPMHRQITLPVMVTGMLMGMSLVAAAAADAQAQSTLLRGLPITEVPAAHGQTLAIFWSGDGGWKELASTVSTDLAAQGVAVVGVNSRSWLTTATRKPEDAAAATTALLRNYLEKWHRDRVLLIGFSRGAGFLPFIYNGLPADLKSRVDLLAMMGMESTASFEFHLIDLVRTVSRPTDIPVAPELALIARTPLPMLCMYGVDEAGSLCPSLDAKRYILAARAGDHHFDRAYDQIAQQLLHAAGR